MKYPPLVPDWACNAIITICLTDGVTEQGEPKPVKTYRRPCNYSEKSKQIVNAERRLIQLNASAIISGDLCPCKDLSGYAMIDCGDMTIKRTIYTASRARNPDGTVNYTQLELI